MSNNKPEWVNWLLIGVAILLVALIVYELIRKKVELPKVKLPIDPKGAVAIQ